MDRVQIDIWSCRCLTEVSKLKDPHDLFTCPQLCKLHTNVTESSTQFEAGSAGSNKKVSDLAQQVGRPQPGWFSVVAN